MKEQKKKRLIVILLLVSCFISGFMFFSISEGGSKQLDTFAQADSLIQKELTDFNINEQHVEVTTTRIDSHFSRKTYLVRLPYQFSKTQLHAELNSSLHDYSIKTPARVTFPEQNVNIYLSYHGTIIRTISLQTDPDLTINRDHVSVLLAFEKLPNDELINRLASWGEPIPIILKIENPMQANELKKQLGNRYRHILFWLQNDEGEDMLKVNPSLALEKLEQLEDVLPDARIFQLGQGEQIRQRIVAKTDLALVDASDAHLLHEDMGKASFFEEFYKLQTDPDYTMAVITGNQTTLSWLQEKLPELKKAGMDLVSPPQTNF